jgi:hypothetical protein
MTDRNHLTEALEWAVIFDRRDNTGHVVGRAAETSRVIRRAATAMRDFPTDEQRRQLKREVGLTDFHLEAVRRVMFGEEEE